MPFVMDATINILTFLIMFGALLGIAYLVMRLIKRKFPRALTQAYIWVSVIAGILITTKQDFHW